MPDTLMISCEPRAATPQRLIHLAKQHASGVVTVAVTVQVMITQIFARMPVRGKGNGADTPPPLGLVMVPTYNRFSVELPKNLLMCFFSR